MASRSGRRATRRAGQSRDSHHVLHIQLRIYSGSRAHLNDVRAIHAAGRPAAPARHPTGPAIADDARKTFQTFKYAIISIY